MKIKYTLYLFLPLLIIFGCKQQAEEAHEEEAAEAENAEEMVRLTPAQANALDLVIGPIEEQQLTSSIVTSGYMEVPPQNLARITAYVGGNVTQIEVIEGNRVKKGQPLAYLEHPDLVQMQMNYAEAASQLQFLEQEYERQKRLFEERVGSGQQYQQTQANVKAQRARVEGLRQQLLMIGINPTRVLAGNVARKVAVVSPINGFVKEVEVALGQYVPAQEDMFEVVNNEHVHVDLMVFEQDVLKVQEGQLVKFQVGNRLDTTYTAKVYAVGKVFEDNPKAVHVHADIQGDANNMIPGIYVKGRILTGDATVAALPEEAVIQEGEKSYIFVKIEAPAHHELEEASATTGEKEMLYFTPVEVITGERAMGMVAITPAVPLPEGTMVAKNAAYYLLAEMKKGEAEHAH